jgi:hypothetical protein
MGQHAADSGLTVQVVDTRMDGLDISSRYRSIWRALTSLVIASSRNCRCMVLPGTAFIMYCERNGLLASTTAGSVRPPHGKQAGLTPVELKIVRKERELHVRPALLQIPNVEQPIA